MKKEIIKPTTIFKDYYVVQNYGGFRDMFYHYRDAVAFCKNEGVYDGECLYQIYKCTVEIKNPIQKHFSI